MRRWTVLLAGIATVTALVVSVGGQQPQNTTFVDGKHSFDVYCSTCHGAGGKGDGALANSLRKRPADLTQLAKKNDGKFPADAVAKFVDGRTREEAHTSKSDMPVWGDAFSKSQTTSSPEQVKAAIDALVRYIGTLQEKPDDPK